MRLLPVVPQRGDGLVATGLVVLGEAELWFGADGAGRFPATIAVLVACGALAWRRRSTVVVALVVSGALGATAIFAPDTDVLAQLLALVVAVYSLGAEASQGETILGGLAVLAITWCAVALSKEASWGSFAFTGIAVAVPLLAGRALREQEDTAAALKREGEELLRARDARTREAVTKERGRIARELHDIVAHSVSMGVQASAGRRILDRDPDRVATARSGDA